MRFRVKTPTVPVNHVATYLGGLLSHRVPGVDHLGMMVGNQLDEPLSVQVTQRPLGQGSAHLQTLGNNGGGDQLAGGHFLKQFLVGGLVEQHLVVQLVADLSLGPLLLLGLAAASSLLLLLCLLRLLGRRLRVLLRGL